MRVCVKEDNDEFPPVPPGFEAFTSFTLKRVNESDKQDSQNSIDCSVSTGTSELQSLQMDAPIDVSDVAKTTRPIRRKPWINYGKYDYSSEDESDFERLNQVSVVFPRLLRICF